MKCTRSVMWAPKFAVLKEFFRVDFIACDVIPLLDEFSVTLLENDFLEKAYDHRKLVLCFCKSFHFG